MLPSRPGARSEAAGEDDPAEADPAVHALGSGTGLRFVLLVVLVTASTVSMMSDHIVLRRFLGDPHNDVAGCNIAAGFDPGGTYWENFTAVIGRNAAALEACTEPFQTAWWAPIVVVGTVFALAAALCWATPLWKIRRRGLRPVDPSSEAGAALRGLAAGVGLPSARFVVDWASGSMNAVAFGRPGRTCVSLPGGLLLTRTTDPDRFVAIVLHELAHLRYRDAGITYATIALWQVFALTMLLPYLARFVELFVTSQFFLTDAFNHVYLASSGPDYARSVALCLFTALLVYLSRSDILRTRELYADRRAVDWGASGAVWDMAGRAPDASRRARRRTASAVSALFVTHPSWARRAQALRDPEILFRVPALPTFLTGAAAVLIGGHLQGVPGWAGAPITWAGAAVAGALVAGTTCLTLWRRTAHAVSIGREAPSGVRAGLWLSAGLATGSLFVDSALERGHWFPTAFWLTLLLGLIASVATCWTAQCACLVIAAVPARSVRLPAAVGLLGAAGVFAFWLNWWQTVRHVFRPEILALLYAQTSRVLAAADHGSSPAVRITSVVVTTMAMLGSSIVWPTVALWFVPLIAWLGPTAGDWLVRNGLPSLRRMLAAGAVAGLLSVVLAFIIVLAMNVTINPYDTGSTMRLMAAVLAAFLVGPLGTAALAAAVAGARNGMLVGAIVAGVAVLCSVGITLGAFGLSCLLPGMLGGGSCGEFASGTWPIARLIVLMLLGPGVFVAAIVALVVSGVVSSIRRPLGRHGRGITAEDRVPASSTVLAVRRAGVVTILVLAVGLNVLTSTSPILSSGGPPVPANLLGDVNAPVPTTQQARHAQVVAWMQYGGADLWTSLGDSLREIGDGAKLLGEDDAAGVASIRSGCAGIGRWAIDARAYFTIPDPHQQALWERAQSMAENASADCLAAVDAEDSDALLAAVRRIDEAVKLALSVSQWMSAQRR